MKLQAGDTPNFAAWLIDRMGWNGRLIDADSGETVGHDGGTETGSLAQAVRRAAGIFRALHMRPDQCAVLLMETLPDCALAYLGAVLAGNTVVPINVRTDPNTLSRIADQVDVGVVWARSPAQLARVDASRHRAVVGVRGDLASEPCDRDREVDARLAVLMPTSGSTGSQRLVRVTHANLISNTTDIVSTQRLAAEDRALLALPLSYCFGASVLHSHLAVGGDIVFFQGLFADDMLSALSRFRCSNFAGVPTLYSMLLRVPAARWPTLPCLRRWLQAGGRLDPRDIDRIRARTREAEFYVMYGQTEATARISCLGPDDIDRKRGSVGRPLPSLRLSVAPDTGEIMVFGPSVTDGYWNDPKATAERFIDGWLRTGDVGRIDEDGFIWLDGRLADFAKIGGIRVGYSEVESRLREFRGIGEAAVVSIPHDVFGEALAVFVTRDSEANSAASDIEREVIARLPSHWAIAHLEVVDTLPTNSNGKVDRLKLLAARHACAAA